MWTEVLVQQTWELAHAVQAEAEAKARQGSLEPRCPELPTVKTN